MNFELYHIYDLKGCNLYLIINFKGTQNNFNRIQNPGKHLQKS
jgi:hypothetical protein